MTAPPTDPLAGQDVPPLRRDLRTRHLVMISLGGVIGSGLFISSGYTIYQAGPLGAVLAYGVGAVVAWLLMTCLGELAVQMPESGGFHVYAHRTLGPATGFTTAWLYWLCWVAAIGSELTASGLLMQRWFPGVPVWVWCAVFAAVLLAVNLSPVRVYGDAESLLAGVKVTAVVVFIVVGALAIVGVRADGRPAPLLSGFHTADGYFPAGLGGVLVATLAVFYAFSGTELIAIAAGETDDPAPVVPKAVRTTMVRLVVFFVGAIVVMAALVPYDRLGSADESVETSPFVTVFTASGIPHADDVIAVVIITALLSAGSSGLYACSRLLRSLALTGDLPVAFARTGRSRVPLLAVVVSLGAGLVSLVSSVVAPGTVYVVLVSVAGFAVVAVWAVIALAQVAQRRRLVALGTDVRDLPYRVRWYPAAPVLVVLACAVAVVASLADSGQRLATVIGVVFTALCYLAHALLSRRRRAGASPAPRTEVSR
ncbi:amino acid permease [Kineococcus sp. NPDC059986]|uniref:amino acid permease n=1 Tax=Kineococcus sp. NPDC059986 TaxID=3155538 RepID=UPI00344B58B5